MRKWTLVSFSVALILLLTTWCVHGQDLYEPNNHLGDATGIDLDQTIGGSIFPDRDVDSYGFDLNSPGILKVILESIPEDMKARIDLYGKNFNWITRKDASNVGDTVTLEIDIAEPGRYYIVVSDLDGKSHNVEYSFKVTFEPVADSMEPNNKFGDATGIDLDQIVSGYIFPAGDVDSYGFDLNSPGILKVILESVPEDMKARIDLYGKNFNWITRKDASNAGDTVTLEIDIAEPGRYYIVVSDLDGKSHNVEYSFKVTFEPVADSMEPNNKFGDATGIDLDQIVSGYIFPAGDVDSYGFDLNSPGILKVILESVPEDMKARIDLYGKNFNWITRKDASNVGDTVTLEIDIAEPGRYYIVVSDLDGKSHNVEYSFKVTFEPVADSMEPNNKFGDATGIDLDQIVSGYIFPAGDVDSYGFDLNSPGILKVILESVPEDMKARIDLYGKNFNWITRKDASNAGDTVTLEIDIAEPGRYYIVVSDLDGKSHDVEYSFKVIPESMSDVTGKIGDATKQGGTKTSSDSTGTSTSVGSAGSVAASYHEATITHSGFDFSQGTTGEYPTYDGEIIGWQPGAATHPDYPRDSGYLWWRNTHLDDVNFAGQTKDIGEVDLSMVREVPAKWDKSPLVPPLLVGHTIVAKCYDGYVKFQVISVDPTDESARVKYWYSPDTAFDDTIS